MENNNTILTAEDVKEISNALAEETNEDIELVKSLPSNGGEGVDEEIPNPEILEGFATINPVTGAYRLDERSDEEKALDEEMAKMLNVEVENLYDIPESIYDIPYNEELIKKNISEHGISEVEVINELLPIIERFRKQEKADYYSLLPQKIKDMINQQCAIVGVPMQEIKNARKMFSEEFLRAIIADAGFDSVVIDMQKEMQKAYDLKPLMSMLIETQKTQFEENIDKRIRLFLDSEVKPELEEKKQQQINNLKAVKEAYIQSYTLDDFIRALTFNKIKIKKIDVDKYQRHIRDFNYKYEGDTPFIIRDIRDTIPVLKRKFDKYPEEYIIKFIVAFIKFTMNMSAKDPIDHTFMSYFISNIISLDEVATTEGEYAFIDMLMSRLDLAIRFVNGEIDHSMTIGPVV